MNLESVMPAGHPGFVSFADQLRATVARRGDAVAVECEDRSLTFRQLFDRACRLANGLAALGVRPGDRVATLAANRLESVEEICAIALLGAVRAPLYAHNAVDVHLHMLSTVDASALIVAEQHWPELAERADRRLRVVVHGTAGPGTHGYDELLAASSPADPMVGSGPDDVVVIRFSSGTTGLPKGIMHRQDRYMATGEAMAATMGGFTDASVQIVAGPMSHISGVFFWPVIAAGARQIVMPRFDAARFLDHIVAGGTFSTIVPTMLASILDAPNLPAALRAGKLSGLRRLGYGGAPIDERLLRRGLAAFGPVFVQTYGQSEACPVSALPPEAHDLSRPDADPAVLRSAGAPVPGAQVRLVDDAGADVAPGEVGEVAIRAPWTLSEIWGDPAAAAARTLPTGHLRTRDMGRMRDGLLYLVDRKDDMIISGGYNIWPTELENALLAHEDVREAAVFGVPHPRWGETPVAAVTLRPGAAVTPDELIAWCRARVGGVKKPSQVIVWDEPLPRNGSGKLLRRVLRERHADLAADHGARR